MIKKGKEIWKIYPDYDFIEVSNLGKVRTKDRVVTRSNGRKQFVKGKVLKQQLNKDGYMYVSFNVNGKRFCRSVHRLVAICFIPNPDNLSEVNHKDNDPTNNYEDNLEWCSHEYNVVYREKYGVSAKEYTKVLRKPVIAVDLNGFKVFWFESQSEAARQLGVDNSGIAKVAKGKRYHKTAGSYCFYYADENAVEKIRVKFGNEIADKAEKLIHELPQLIR